ncbi:FliM/FliN family flagellar motor switch protein [Janthinobacterium fluminis]|uniref:Flagellar motor switch protein FliN n=1 Tax=Janthinobacterium fluminis TaxID=2987524 RepID=A0ABT5JUW0_9BURK|nr:FliM/FliN family flagellar motor switch protein [Janthinobacterium fluminis]MDC8756504.1 FliM/FliN family flagellar motor switch protein [Janthinobacterium fluminis]
MNMNETNPDEGMLGDLTEDMIIDHVSDVSDVTATRTRRDIPQMMRKIPVTLTLEVGSARISLQELMAIGPDSVIELDMLAGEPLVIKVNGTPIGRAEVVVAGENYGLKVIDLDGLNLDMMTS